MDDQLNQGINVFNMILEHVAVINNRLQRIENAILLSNRFLPIQQQQHPGVRTDDSECQGENGQSTGPTNEKAKS